MQNIQIERSKERGSAKYDWLETYHSFSFSSYYNPQKVHFGALRVLNDDFIAPKMGFPMHPHENMEIITLVLSGELRHEDSMGNVEIIRPGEIQIMSAGTGIMHSEYNNSSTEELNLLQIWVFPDKKNVSPRYQQFSVPSKETKGWTSLLSPQSPTASAWIHQDAYFSLGSFSDGDEISYSPHEKTNGLYLFLIEGSAKIENATLEKRDSISIRSIESLQGKSTSPDTRILLMEIPLQS